MQLLEGLPCLVLPLRFRLGGKDDRSDLKLAVNVKEFVFRFLREPIEVRELDLVGLEQRADEAAADPETKVRQVANEVLQLRDRALRDKLPARGLYRARGDKIFEEVLEVVENFFLVHVEGHRVERVEQVRRLHLFLIALLELDFVALDQILDLRER